MLIYVIFKENVKLENLNSAFNIVCYDSKINGELIYKINL